MVTRPRDESSSIFGSMLAGSIGALRSARLVWMTWTTLSAPVRWGLLSEIRIKARNRGRNLERGFWIGVDSDYAILRIVRTIVVGYSL